MKPTFVEPINGVEEVKKTLRAKDVEKTTITVVMKKDTAIYLRDLLEREFANKSDNFRELIELAETCKDLSFDNLCGDIIGHLKAEHPNDWKDYLKYNVSDFTGGSLGSDNR
jgi:hypothetical protein